MALSKSLALRLALPCSLNFSLAVSESSIVFYGIGKKVNINQLISFINIHLLITTVRSGRNIEKCSLVGFGRN